MAKYRASCSAYYEILRYWDLRCAQSDHPALERLKAGQFTSHGFRSAFRDWAGDLTTFSREVTEEALAHRVGDSTELAYRRADALEKRRKLMAAWAGYCTTVTDAAVVRMVRA